MERIILQIKNEIFKHDVSDLSILVCRFDGRALKQLERNCNEHVAGLRNGVTQAKVSTN